jgi:hypothetical protein
MTKARWRLGNVGRSAEPKRAQRAAQCWARFALPNLRLRHYAPPPSSRHGVSRDPVPAYKPNSKKTSGSRPEARRDDEGALYVGQCRAKRGNKACPTNRLNVGHASLCPTYDATPPPPPSSRHGVSRDPVPAHKPNSKKTSGSRLEARRDDEGAPCCRMRRLRAAPATPPRWF